MLNVAFHPPRVVRLRPEMKQRQRFQLLNLAS